MKKYLSIFLVTAFFIIFLQIPVLASDLFPDSTVEEDFSELLSLLFSTKYEPKETKELMNRWAEYLNDLTSIDIESHKSILTQIDKEYSQAIRDLESCYGQYRSQETMPSMKWIEALQKNFNRKSIVKNQDGIKACLLALNAKNSYQACDQLTKQSIYLEVLRTNIYKTFLNQFLAYCSELNETDRKFMSKRESAAKKLLKFLASDPIITIQSDNYYQQLAMQMRAENHTDPHIFQFIMNSKELSQPFDVMAATDKLDELIHQK